MKERRAASEGLGRHILQHRTDNCAAWKVELIGSTSDTVQGRRRA